MRALLVASLVLACSANILAATPAPSQWPLAFTVFFNETTSYYGEAVYTGGFGLYDYPNGHMNWTRFNGAACPLCNSTFPDLNGTACAQLVSNQTVFLHAPEADKCCKCCSEADGCGMPTPNNTANFTYLGQAKYYGRKAYYWQQFINGYEVVYVETAQKKALQRDWLALFTPFDNYTYVSDFNRTVENNSFELPTSCQKAHFCSGVCADIRNQGSAKLRGSRQSIIRAFPFI